VASVLDIDDECVGIRHIAPDGTEPLASLVHIDLEPNLDVAVLQHTGPSWIMKLRMEEFRQISQSPTMAVEMLDHRT
jgi:hypothetical protein